MNRQHQVMNAEDSVDVISLLEVLWRYKVVVVAATLLGAAIALFLAFTTRFVYQAEVVVTPVADNENGALGSLAGKFGGLANLAGINLQNASGNAVEAQAMLRSRHLAEQFIARNKLEGVVLAGSGKRSLWRAVDLFQRTVVKITQDREKGTTTVSVRWRDPVLAANWANQYVAMANEILRNRALAESSSNIKFLNEQISKTSVVEIQRVMYGLIENETKNHMLASTRLEYAFTVVDPAVTPEDRVWPRRSLMLISGVAIGGVLGAFFALVHNMWRRRSEVARR